VIAAMRAAAPEVWQYGDPEVHALRHAIAASLALAPENIAVGEGIDGLMNLIVRLTIAPGDIAITSLGTYPTLAYHVAGFGGELVSVPYRGRNTDLGRLAETANALRGKTKLVYLANPDNPMGGWHEPGPLVDFIAAIDPDITILLDEAYCETLAEPLRLPLDFAPPNLVRTRTFSKTYGLAGMRVGYAVGAPGFIAAFDRVRNHFGISRMSQVAALAALDDPDWLIAVERAMRQARLRLEDIARDNGLDPLPSATNFVTMDTGRDGAYAQGVLRSLEGLGVFIRKPMAPGLDSCIRISAGPPAALDVFAEKLPEALRTART
jgi:histidinol-phosphate aminotransferase